MTGIVLIFLCLLCTAVTGFAEKAAGDELQVNDSQSTIRIATFNVSLYGKKAGEIRSRLGSTDDAQARRIASIVQTVRPDILLVNELDYEPDSAPAKLLAKNYFAVGQDAVSRVPTEDGQKLKPIVYPYVFSAPSNTGIDSAMDLNQDGELGSGNDAWGYGIYPGQYAMTVYSRFPIDQDAVRTFQRLRWATMPGALRPTDPKTGESYYDDATWNALRLSSKNHIDVPIKLPSRVVHVLASHPTPPVFDGPEDRNGARNHDEVAFWTRYIDDSENGWIRDDSGNVGGLGSDAAFVVMGDLNADPDDGSGRRKGIRELINSPRVNDVRPSVTKADAIDRVPRHKGTGNVLQKTSNFGRNGYMRVDYVLPSADLKVSDSGVFWPASSDPRSNWVKASDHRMVWIEVEIQ